MMALFKPLQNQMLFDDCCIHSLIVENKKLFRCVINSFEFDFSEDYFVFSQNFTPFEFSKKGIYISNPLNPDITSKKLVNKLDSYLEGVCNDEYPQKIEDIKSRLFELASKLVSLLDYDIDFNCDIDTSSLIKLLSFTISRGDEAPASLLLRYILLASKYLKISLFVIPHLNSFFTCAELDGIYETLALNNINVLSIDCTAQKNPPAHSTVHIVDSDFCLIDTD
ncbi:MAG: type II-A CRISPR-associated protein Csn2 [Clostridiales bacterium]|nr:type II-A CRISPR-associated protein Csn2 [Clostridiales bacterium]